MLTSHAQWASPPFETDRPGRIVFVFAPLVIWVLMGLAMAAPSVAASATVPYQKAVGNDCDAASCKLRFGKVGKNRTVRIDSVSCFLSSDERATLTRAQLLTGSNVAHALVPVRVSKAFPQPSYALNHRTNIVAKAGQHIRVRLVNDRPYVLDHLSCKIAGTAHIRN